MAGIIDVITEVALDDPALRSNRIVSAILTALNAPLPATFEVIVDYKGMRRPPTRTSPKAPDYWNIYEWQLQTYATLRSRQPDARPVAAGVLLYLNELRPSVGDIAALRRELRGGLTDVVPEPGSNDEQFLTSEKSRGFVPDLSFSFRLKRALRIVAISRESQQEAARHFDDVVLDIEIARARERQSPHIREQWPNSPFDDATCVACDWRAVCPAHPEVAPSLPTESA